VTVAVPGRSSSPPLTVAVTVAVTAGRDRAWPLTADRDRGRWPSPPWPWP